MGSSIKWFCRQNRKSKLSKADLEGPAYKVVRAFHSNSISLQFRMEECHLLLTDQIDLVNPEGHRVLGLKNSYRHYGLKEFYINRHSAPSDRLAFKFHMRILSVVSLKTISRYGYTYLKEIVLRIVDYKEYKISESNFKNLHPNDFEDLYMLHLQGKLNHLSGSDKVNLFNADASNFLFKEDYTIVSNPRAIIYRDRNDPKTMIRETKVHKFSDGTLTRILEKLDHMVKDFKLFKYNPGMETRIWSEDVRRRSKEFMEVIERRLKIRRIFRSLESFVSERRSDTCTGNPVNEILLKLNLPDHKSVLMDSEVQVKMEMEIPRSSRVNFITACSYSTDTSKDIMKAQVYVSKLSQL
ncbi:hypothetical protein Tco_0643264 [Tanacetum coccineum]